MIPLHLDLVAQLLGIPRESGDDPVFVVSPSSSATYSPRERG